MHLPFAKKKSKGLKLNPNNEYSEWQRSEKETLTGGTYMTGEEFSGPPGPKLTRLVYFVGAGVACTFAINKWREYERNMIIRQQQQGAKEVPERLDSSDSVAVHKALK